MNTSAFPDVRGPLQVSCHDVHYTIASALLSPSLDVHYARPVLSLRCTDGEARWGAIESGLTFCFMYGGDHCCGRCKFGDFRSEATHLGPTISRMYILFARRAGLAPRDEKFWPGASWP